MNFRSILILTLFLLNGTSLFSFAIIHSFETVIERKSLSTAIITETKDYTITDQSSIYLSKLIFYYDPTIEINSVKVSVYSPSGELLKTYKLKDFEDLPIWSDGTLYSDLRFRSLNIAVTDFPVRISYESIRTNHATNSFDGWKPAYIENCEVQEATLKIITNDKLDINYLISDDRIQLIKSSSADNKTYEFKLSNHISTTFEPFSESKFVFGPFVMVAPLEFKYLNYKGSFKTWDEHGKWYASLSEGRDEISDKTKAEIQKIKQLYEHQTEKLIAEIYKYMQKRTRYVNISPGIAGWQPISALDVDTKGYGDCKALSNYTISLLRHAGIEAYAAIIGVGRQQILNTEFASLGQANHVMVCAPLANDTIWLECTSTTLPCGILHDNSLNRLALLVKPNSYCVMVKTPLKNKIPSMITTKGNFTITESGDAICEVNRTWTGTANDYPHWISTLNQQEQRLEILQLLPSNKTELTMYKISIDSVSGNFTLLLHYKIKGHVNLKNAYPILNCGLFDPFKTPLSEKTRNSNFQFTESSLQKVSFEFHLPKGYNASVQHPLQYENSSAFDLQSELRTSAQTLHYDRELISRSGLFPASENDAFIKILQHCSSFDHAQIPLVKESNE